MNDSRVLVHGVPHVYQFEQGKSAYRCEAASLAALSAFAHPNHWPNLSELMHEIYTKYVPGGDVPANKQGMTKEQALEWCKSNGIGVCDLQWVVDKGDPEELRRHMGAMNKSGIPILLGINDESHLYQATQQADSVWVRGPKMHNWNDKGLRHALVRVGMDMVHPVTLLDDPATACPPFAYPTPVLWDDLRACGINTALGIMPPGVPAPPESFHFHTLDGVDHVWPEPPPKVDVPTAAQIVAALKAKMQVLEHDSVQMQADLEAAQKALGQE